MLQCMIKQTLKKKFSIDKITAYTTCKQEVSRLAAGTANHT